MYTAVNILNAYETFSIIIKIGSLMIMLLGLSIPVPGCFYQLMAESEYVEQSKEHRKRDSDSK